MQKLCKGERYALFDQKNIGTQRAAPPAQHIRNQTTVLKHPVKRIVTTRTGQLPNSRKGRIGQIGFVLTKILIFVFMLFNLSDAWAQSGRILSGEVRSAADGQPLQGVTITEEKGKGRALTDQEGRFAVRVVAEQGRLLVSYIGHQSQTIAYNQDTTLFQIQLEPGNNEIDEVEVVSTGYQQLPKERATGSFVQIDNELLERRVGKDILDRLDGVTNGLVFNRNNQGGANNSAISIRGRSTIFGTPDPLIILDNFPYEGDITNINPQDVETITILKDAAAASIWGTRAGNGVIVITTKKGKLNTPPQISANANVTVAERPDLYYLPQLSSKEYIEHERYLFERGRYNSTINNGYGALSPAVQALLDHRSEQIDDAELMQELDFLATIDNREQLEKYFYRQSVNQQYQANIRGGGGNQHYFASVGYDRNVGNGTADNQERVTLNFNNTFNFLNHRLSVSNDVLIGLSSNASNLRRYLPRYPYERVADEEGNSLVVTDGTLRAGYEHPLYGDQLLDWSYRPLDENRANHHGKSDDYRINTTLNYKLNNALSFSAHYLYQNGRQETVTHDRKESYYVRNQINTHMQVEGNELVPAIPYGDIVNNSTQRYAMHNGRFQMAFEETFRDLHRINAIAGFEVRSHQGDGASSRLYGYDPETATNQNAAIDFTKDYLLFPRGTRSRIVTGLANGVSIDRNRAYYFNASYDYAGRYVFSLSARRDESNIFGVDANQRGVPLWSAGAMWNIHEEQFYNGFLSLLKLRFTYGYNGNVDKSTTAYLTAINQGHINRFSAPFMYITNPPNPSLRWERVKNINLGLDFATAGNRVNGSVEYYVKNGMDLIGDTPLAPQTGLLYFRGNSADMRTTGVDFLLNTINMQSDVTWTSNFMFNYVKDEITAYEGQRGTNMDVIRGNYQNPLVGHPYNSIFALGWQGLTETGDPQVSLNGEPSTDYAAIRNDREIENIRFMGSGAPLSFGSLRNNVRFKGAELSFNVTYKFGYRFRRQSLENTSLNNGSQRMADYANRWRQAGDEQHTDVPALVYPSNTNRAMAYEYADVLIENGAHLRLQDIRFSYRLSDAMKVPFRVLEVYSYANNLGILWRANKQKIDPDAVRSMPSPTSIAAGIRCEF